MNPKSMYVFNAAALTKPHAIEHLTADLIGHNIDAAVITETHLKQKHCNAIASIQNYTIFRRDRKGRKGGGVAIYVKSILTPSEWIPPEPGNSEFEIIWVKVGDFFISALYHPPKPHYSTYLLLNYIEMCVEEIRHLFPKYQIVIAGDLNQMADSDIIERTGLTQIVHQPTRGANILDRLFASNPTTFTKVRVVLSTAKSDHRAIIAYSSISDTTPVKTTVRRQYRRKSPNQHAAFLRNVAKIDFCETDLSTDTQAEFDKFYSQAYQLLNNYYPERTITITSRDPEYITPDIKTKLRRKNRLMRAGRIEEANALSRLIGIEISRKEKTRLCKIGGKSNAKDMWEAVRRLTCRQPQCQHIPGVTANSLNNHYARISTDPDYLQPLYKQTASTNNTAYINEWEVFRILDHLPASATGPDLIPAWFLRLGAPLFAKPIARLFNLSVATSVVPQQWKQACIRPIPKVSSPSQHSDFRPISITPVLTRIMEKTIVRHFLYPAFLNPMQFEILSDQFAFRPTGSTSSAIIYMLHAVTNLLATNPYVIVISLDFSKAFDTVRHYTLLQKLAQLNLPDNIYNWLVNFFNNHSHCTDYRGLKSDFIDISASIIQGSGLGPSSYVINASDLKAQIKDNELMKYADDTYLIIPARNDHSRQLELDNIEQWAKVNNLKLNREKCHEIIFVDPRRPSQSQLPVTLKDVKRVDKINILGVTITNHLSLAHHVRDVISRCAQTLYAIRVLRAHGMCPTALQTIFRSVVVTKITYASSAWWGFSSAADRQRIDGFFRRSKRCGMCPSTLPTFEELCRDADNALFQTVLTNTSHVLHKLLPPQSSASQNYNLRKRHHCLELTSCKTSLIKNNFVNRMLFKDSY